MTKTLTRKARKRLARLVVRSFYPNKDNHRDCLGYLVAKAKSIDVKKTKKDYLYDVETWQVGLGFEDYLAVQLAKIW